MTHQRDFDDLLREWADHGDERLPDHYLRAALLEIETTAQRGDWRSPLEGLIMRLQPAAPVLGVVAVAIAAVALYFAFAQPNIGDRDASPTPLPSAPVESDAPSAEPSIAPVEARPLPASTTTVELGRTPTALRAGEDAVYASVGDELVRVDAVTGEVVSVVTVPDTETSCSDCQSARGLYAFDVGDASAWVAYHLEDQSLIRRFSLTDGAVEADILIGTAEGGGSGADDIVYAFGSVWTAQCHSGTVARIDPATNEQVASIRLGTGDGVNCPLFFSIGASDDSIWVGATVGNEGGAPTPVILRIDPENNELMSTLTPSSLVQACGHFAFDNGSAWMASCTDSNARGIVGINAQEDAAGDPILLGGLLGDPVLHEGLVWVPVVAGSPTGRASLVAIHPENGEVTDEIDLAADVAVTAKTAAAAVIAFDALWVHGGGGTLYRIPLADLAG